MNVHRRIGSEDPYIHTYMHIKSRAIPLQAWTNPEGFRSLRLTDFKRVGT